MTNYKLELLPKAKRYISSLKRHPQLIKAIMHHLQSLLHDPFIGNQNKGDLKDTYSVDFRHQKTTYEIAYKINEETDVILIILIGTRENFYEELKRYIRSSK